MLAPAVIGMGMTTPLIMHVAKEELKNIGRTIGIFYGLNIFGAAIGALISGLVLIETFGLTGSNYLAALLNIGIGCVALLLIRTENALSMIQRNCFNSQFT
jgi:predicted membrane-bound spermidine synthase